MLAIALVALIASACSVSRSASVKSEVRGLTAEVRDSVRVEQVMVAVHDTIVETTTIIVRENEQGDTLRLSKVTERDRIRDRAEVKEQQERVVVQRDTVFVAIRDSTNVQKTSFTDGGNRPSAFVSALKWVFAIAFLLLTSVVLIRVWH